MQTLKTKRDNRVAIRPENSAGRIDELDRRTRFAQEMRGRFNEIANDLGGVGRLSYAQRSLIERAVWLEHWIAKQERVVAAGDDVDVGKLTQATNSLLGIYRTLGIERQAKKTPSLNEYLAKQAES